MNVIVTPTTNEVPTTRNQMIAVFEEKLFDCLLKFESYYKRAIPIPKIQLERLGRIYGKATHANSLIRMNVDLCIPKFWNEMLNDTLPHEAAHIISPLIYSPNRHGFDKNSGWGHGRAWAECMRVLGLQPKRCGSSFDEETLEKVLYAR